MLLLSYLVIYCCSSIWPSCCQGLRCRLLVATPLFCQFGLSQALANYFLPGMAALLGSPVFGNLLTLYSFSFCGLGGWSSFLSRNTLPCNTGLIACHPMWNAGQLLAVYDCCLFKSLAVLCASSNHTALWLGFVTSSLLFAFGDCSSSSLPDGTSCCKES